MNKHQKLAQQLRMEAGRDGFHSFEATPGRHNWETMENLLVARGVPRPQARSMVAAEKFRSDLPTDQGQGLRALTQDPTWGNPSSIAAQLTINVERVVTTGVAIQKALPYVIYGLLDASNGYRRAIQGQLPAGVTLTSVRYGENVSQPEALVFTYTDGVNVETVTVTCGAAPYPMVLQSTDTNAIYVDRVRLALPDENFLATGQFLTDVKVMVRNTWGTNNSRSLNPGSFKSPEQYQEAILDLNVGVNFDRETMLVGEIQPPAPAPNPVRAIVSHIMFVQAFTAVRA